MKTITLLSILALSSCASLESYITKQPITTVPVQRVDGKPFKVALSDVIRAENAGDATWGLYNASAALGVVEQGSGK